MSYILIVSLIRKYLIVVLALSALHSTYNKCANFGQFSLKEINSNFWSNHLTESILTGFTNKTLSFKFSLKTNFNHNTTKFYNAMN